MHNVCNTKKAILFQITEVSIVLALPPSCKIIFFLLALQPIVGLYFAAL